ncbi:MAG: hypothetical protein E6G47_06480 [Actinobacteria bacterium]|nr:MAG: hypothetical protein E6G47_06480 [Actinomycetota bacterium]
MAAPVGRPPGLGALARGGVRRQQPRAALDHVHRALGHDLPALRRGAHQPSDDRGRALFPGDDNPLLPPPALPHGRGTAPRLAARVRRAGAPPRDGAGRGRSRGDGGARGSRHAERCCARRVRPGDVRARGEPRRAGVDALIPSTVRNRRLFGGLVVHVGIATMAIAITTSSAFAHQTEVTLARGGLVSFQGYSLEYRGLRTIQQPQRVVREATVTVAKGGRALGSLTPSLNEYPASTDPIGSPSIHYGVLRDLYSSLVGFDATGGEATFRFFLNPGVFWLWVGGAIVVLGGLLAAWPARRRRTAAAAPAPVPGQLASVG